MGMGTVLISPGETGVVVFVPKVDGVTVVVIFDDSVEVWFKSAAATTGGAGVPGIALAVGLLPALAVIVLISSALFVLTKFRTGGQIN